ncbi:MAG: hypothetical protein KatS3mg129_2306 [Leptospiraceae bacterium]|nr:MAG: hypothetical protein KatS3mg129_2306 [Leptospiraceae bacterium]
MKNKKGNFFYLILTMLLIQSCAAIPPGGGGGYLYNDFSGPYILIDKQLEKKELKESRSIGRCILSLVCWGDITISNTAIKGNIREIKYVEYEYYNIAIFYSSTTIVVKGYE